MANGENIDLHKWLVDLTSRDGTGSDISTLLIQIMDRKELRTTVYPRVKQAYQRTGNRHISATLWNLIEDHDQGSSSKSTWRVHCTDNVLQVVCFAEETMKKIRSHGGVKRTHWQAATRCGTRRRGSKIRCLDGDRQW